ncbi:hypothetical protein CEXT_190151 [Caerostris extrusa]|uniref:B30.2/SPRY domain-containing protein n=1 Tax=Caerostris extrusa TaxID=172846 RepID=A0AAV4P1W4_CAEEX|nr:hypothetical protein CEXT_190151 [Caerostris extrusa]
MADTEAKTMDDGKNDNDDSRSCLGEMQNENSGITMGEEIEEKMDCDPGPDLGTNTNQTESAQEPNIEQLSLNDTSKISPPSQNGINHTESNDKVIPENFQVMQVNKDTSNNSQKEISKKKTDFSETNGNEESQCFVDEQSQDPQNCYCGRERNLNVVELQCGGCSKWFHEQCISIPLGKCLPFMTYYSFFCKHCNASGVETFTKKQPNFSQMCATALANLMQKCSAEGKPRAMFSKDKEVIPYIVTNWEFLTAMQRRIKQTWHNTVHKVMIKDSDVFICEENGFDGGPMFGLVNQDLSKIGPSYDSTTRGPQKLNIDSSSSQGAFNKGRGTKRKFFDGQMSGPGKKVKSDLVMPNCLQMDWAGKPIPGWLYRKLTPGSVLIALHDRAPQLKISDDRLTITGEKGYCMARATHGVNRGTWYFEVTMDDVPDGAATRIGWSQPLANLQGPLGYDKFSYSWRSRKGTKFHESRGYHYTDEGYGQGDTLGFLIDLPHKSNKVTLPPFTKISL